MIVRWLMANTKAIETRERDGKTYYVMIDAGRSAQGWRDCSPRCSASRPRGLPGSQGALRDLRRSPSTPSLRDEVVRAGREAGPAVLHGVRDAEARAGARRGRQRGGRRHCIPARFHGADARLLCALQSASRAIGRPARDDVKGAVVRARLIVPAVVSWLVLTGPALAASREWAPSAPARPETAAQTGNGPPQPGPAPEEPSPAQLRRRALEAEDARDASQQASRRSSRR